MIFTKSVAFFFFSALAAGVPEEGPGEAGGALLRDGDPAGLPAGRRGLRRIRRVGLRDA